MSTKIMNHSDLNVYRDSVALAMELFELSRRFPKEETYSLTDQVRRSSRSVCANLAEAWRKRRYAAMFVAKLADAEGEAAETQVWLEIAMRCGYVQQTDSDRLIQTYNRIIGTLVGMITHPESWVLRPASAPKSG